MERKLFTKNFTLLVLGQASSLFGNHILRLALSMYVLEVTGSAAVLGLDAKFYGGAESAMAVATILGSITAGLLTEKLRSGRVHRMIITVL